MSAIAWLLLVAQVAASGDVPIDADTVADPVLATQRGGFRLPNGIDVALTVQTQTALDGAVVLRTVFHADQSTPTLTVFAPKAGETVAAGTNAPGGMSATATIAPTVSFDNRSGVQITTGTAAPSLVVGTSAAPQDVAAGLGQVVAQVTGVSTDNGIITQADHGGARTVTLQGTDLSITHISGTAFGSAIANSGSDRVIDTQTSVSIDLRNAGPDVLGSSMFRVQDIAIDAMAARAR